jgi:hypothetical protein
MKIKKRCHEFDTLLLRTRKARFYFLANLGEPQILVERHKDDPLDARHDHLDDLDEQLHPLLEDDHEGLDTVLRINDILV